MRVTGREAFDALDFHAPEFDVAHEPLLVDRLGDWLVWSHRTASNTPIRAWRPVLPALAISSASHGTQKGSCPS
jgi:hypothetical protein